MTRLRVRADGGVAMLGRRGEARPAAVLARAVLARAVLAGAVSVMLVLGGCQPADPTIPTGALRIATGSPGGVYYTYGKALAQLVVRTAPRLRPTVLSTAASAENLALLGRGAAEVGFTQADVVNPADPAHPAGLTAVARLYDDYLHLVVPADSPVRTLKELAGLRVSVGAPGSGTVITVERLLGVGGIDPREDIEVARLGLAESAAALLAGRLDAFFFSGGPPVAAVEELAAAKPIRLVSLGEYVDELRDRYGEFYMEKTVPSSVYRLSPTTTIGVPNYLVVGSGLTDAAVHALTRALFENIDDLSRAHPVGDQLGPRQAISTYPLPLHPGAASYYRAAKP